ncbi:hypothetical protein KSP39_PZI008941 [Platanthera zijinensis]|uniref:Uncharacterized protein n=1 Tax=Platanthera zijinensis TaxID=2320716 RepID=A0AAP0G7P6_9ASPA
MPTTAQLQARAERRRELWHLHAANTTGLPPRTYRPRGRPRMYASSQDRRDTTNVRRREARQLQRLMETTAAADNLPEQQQTNNMLTSNPTTPYVQDPPTLHTPTVQKKGQNYRSKDFWVHYTKMNLF